MDKVAIYFHAWAIVMLLADGSFHNLYPVIGDSPTLFRFTKPNKQHNIWEHVGMYKNIAYGKCSKSKIYKFYEKVCSIMFVDVCSHA